MSRRALLVLALVASGCEKDAKPATPGSAASGSAGSATPGSAAACSDAEIKQRMDRAFAAITRYFGEIEKRVPAWQDCAVATKDFAELEPMANAYMAEVMAVMDWGKSLGSACSERAKQMGQSHDEAKTVEQRFGPLEGKIKDVLTRCEQHPGFKDAASKGLRVMKKKK